MGWAPPGKVVASGEQRSRCQRKHAQDDEHRQQRPDPAQVGAIRHTGDRQPTHDDRRGRDEEVHDPRGALEGRDDEIGRHVGERSQGAHDRHRHGGQTGRRGNQERERQEQAEHDDRESGSTDVAERLLCPVQDGVSDLAVVHHDCDAASDADDQRDPEQVTSTIDEGVRQVELGETPDDADDDAEQEERRRHLGEPPPQGRHPDAEVLPGDDAVHHHAEGQPEHGQDRLVLAGHHPKGTRARSGAEVCLVRLASVSHNRSGGVRLHSICVAEDKDDADREPYDQHHQPQDESLADGRAGEARRDPGGEGVDRRSVGADPATDQDDSGSGEGVVPGRDHDRDDERVEGEALLRHAVRRAAESEDSHQDRDHPTLASTQTGDQSADPALDGAGPHRHPQEAADDDDEQRNVDGPEQYSGVVVADVALVVLDAVQAVDRSGQRVGQDARRVRVDRVVGAGDRCALLVEGVGPGRDEPRRERHHDDETEEDGVRRGQCEPASRLGCGRGFGFGHVVSSGERRDGGVGRVGFPVVSHLGTHDVSASDRCWPGDRRAPGTNVVTVVVVGPPGVQEQPDDEHSSHEDQHPRPDVIHDGLLFTPGRARWGTSCSDRRRVPCPARNPRS